MTTDVHFPINWDISKSPYSSLLDTNHVPSPTELVEMGSFLAVPQRELSNLESEISQLQERLKVLSFKRDRAKAYINAHRALMSAIRRLPTEILIEIFVHCLPTDSYPVRSLKEAPLLLTTVCRSWRNVAIGSAHLWNALHVNFPNEMLVEDIALRASGVQLWLERSGSLPLFISLGVNTARKKYRYRDTLAPKRFIPFFQELMTYSHRFAEVALKLDTETFMLLDSFSPPQFSLLTSFDIRSSPSFFRGEIGTYFAPWIPKSPRLTKLNISGFRIATLDNLLALGCRWGNLTHLALDEMDDDRLSFGPVELLTILKRTPRLQSCSAIIKLDAGQLRFPDTVLELDHIDTMILVLKLGWDLQGSPNEETLQAFYRVIRTFAHFTSLQTLSITENTYHLAMHEGSLPSPLTKLAHLRLGISMSPEGLTRWLLSAPNLTTLEILDRGYDVDVNSVFHDRYPTVQSFHLASLSGASDDDRPDLCPHLATFCLQYPYVLNEYSNLSSDSILDFLTRKRWLAEPAKKQIHKLEVFNLVVTLRKPGERIFSDGPIEQIKKICWDGLKLSVRSLPYDDFYASSGKEENDEPRSGIRESISSIWQRRLHEDSAEFVLFDA